MSDEQDKDALLVDQKDALDFYFDALLLPDENEPSNDFECLDQPEDKASPPADGRAAEQLQSSEQKDARPVSDANKLQSAKAFLKASKLRQNKNKTDNVAQKKTPPEPVVLKTVDKVSVNTTVLTSAAVAKTPLNKPITRVNKAITKGPQSPKPRLKENKTSQQSTALSSKIVFSSTNNSGEVSEQVLIPRSQRLAAANNNKPPAMPKTITPSSQPSIEAIDASISPSIAASRSPAKSEPLEQRQKKSMPKETRQSSQEAPNLDLSLFLPKIKTLSEEEIAQQIEALTQAAVSQAQMESELAHVAELEQISRKILSTQSASDTVRQNSDNAPAWAVPNFQVLLFKVAGLKLAIPLMELNGIVEWGDEYINELPGHKSWYLGIIQNQGKSVPVIDTLQQVVPQKRWPPEHLLKRNFKHIIMIDNARWGLACEEVLEVITLKTDEVKWRSSRTKRRWLLGTVIDQMCALLDSSEFAAMLKTGDDSLLS